MKETIIGHKKRGINSDILKHSREECLSHVWDKDFKILVKSYRSAFKMKNQRNFIYKELKPSRNEKEKLIDLHLYN